MKDAKPDINKGRKEIFEPKLSRTKKLTKIAGINAYGYTYRSSIDETVDLSVAKEIDLKIIKILRRGIAVISYSGHELLKQPAYYYSLKNDLVPLSIKSKNSHWKVSVADDKEIVAEAFAPPGGMRQMSVKEYMHEVVDTISKDVESGQNP